MDEATKVALVAARIAVGEDAETLYDLLEPQLGKTRAKQLVDQTMAIVGREDHLARVNEQRARGRGADAGPTKADFEALQKRLLDMERASRANEAIIAQFRAEQEKKREKKGGE